MVKVEFWVLGVRVCPLKNLLHKLQKQNNHFFFHISHVSCRQNLIQLNTVYLHSQLNKSMKFEFYFTERKVGLFKDLLINPIDNVW